MTGMEKGHGEQYALLAPVGDYRRMGCAALPTWENDQALIEKGLIDGLKFDQDNIRTLGTAGFLSGQEFARAIAGFSKMLHKDDSFVFYFSGHGRNGTLVFSDMPMELQSVLEVIEKLPAKNKIVILDCCYSGDFHVSEPKKMSLEDSILAFAGSGIAVLASSAADEVARLGAGGDHSLYTGAVSAALQTRRLIHKGGISLPDIASEISFLMKLWSKSHPEQSQQPIFRSSMGGTVYFKVADYHPYEPLEVYQETEHYTICSMKPLSTVNIKRLAAFVIPKENVSIRELPPMTREIAAAVKCAQVYSSEKSAARFGSSPARAVWCYFGRDWSDIQKHNYFAYTVWAADAEMEKLYYRENKNTHVIDGICVYENASYQMVRDLMQPSLSREEFIQQTKQLLSTIVTLAEEFISSMQEIENHTLMIRDVKEKYADWIRNVRRQFYQLTDGDVPPDDLRGWLTEVEVLAGCVLDLAIFLDDASEDSFNRREEWLMNNAIRRYYESLEKLKKFEPV